MATGDIACSGPPPREPQRSTRSIRRGRCRTRASRRSRKTPTKPSLNIDRIEVNIVLKDEEFRFPDMALLAKKITVKDMPIRPHRGAVSGVAMMMRAVEARLGANHPGMRKSIRFAAFQGIHWDQVRENDRKFSGLMKELVPPEPVGPRAAHRTPAAPTSSLPKGRGRPLRPAARPCDKWPSQRRFNRSRTSTCQSSRATVAPRPSIWTTATKWLVFASADDGPFQTGERAAGDPDPACPPARWARARSPGRSGASGGSGGGRGPDPPGRRPR